VENQQNVVVPLPELVVEAHHQLISELITVIMRNAVPKSMAHAHHVMAGAALST